MSIEAFCERLFAQCRAEEQSAAYFRFGAKLVKVGFLGSSGLRTFFTKAIAHLESEPAPTDLTVWVVDRASSGIMLPEPAWNWNQMDGYGNIAAFPTDRYYANFQQNANTFTLLDRPENRAIVWVNDVTVLPEWERSFPMRTVLYEWLKDSRYLFLHAGAVGTSQGGVMLTGRGGSGKSTSTLACLDSPLHYAGDDFVMVDTETMYLHSLYNVAKLEWNQLDHFPVLKTLTYNKQGDPAEKAQVFLWDHFPEKISTGFPLKALLLPRFTKENDTRIEPATKAEALQALAPSTMALLKATPRYLAKIRSMVEQVPCYWLLTGKDLKKIPASVASCLAALNNESNP